jgi:hypothetical protein
VCLCMLEGVLHNPWLWLQEILAGIRTRLFQRNWIAHDVAGQGVGVGLRSRSWLQTSLNKSLLDQIVPETRVLIMMWLARPAWCCCWFKIRCAEWRTKSHMARNSYLPCLAWCVWAPQAYNSKQRPCLSLNQETVPGRLLFDVRHDSVWRTRREAWYLGFVPFQPSHSVICLIFGIKAVPCGVSMLKDVWSWSDPKSPPSSYMNIATNRPTPATTVLHVLLLLLLPVLLPHDC